MPAGKLRGAAAAGGAALLALGALWLAGNRHQEPPRVDELAVEFREMTVRGRGDHGREWRLQARRVLVNRERTVTTFLGAQGVLQVGDRVELRMSAPQARLNGITRNLEVAGPVQVAGAGWRMRAGGLRWLAGPERAVVLPPLAITLGDTVVRTGKAYYQAERRIIECLQGVRVRGPDGELAGARLTVYLDREEYVLEDGVTMRFSLAAAERTLAEGKPPGVLPRLPGPAPGKEGRR